MRRRRRQFLIVAVVVPVLAGLALISLRGGASSASTVAPSAQPTASTFARAYVSFLNGRLAASALPDATAGTRAIAASGGRAPATYQGKVLLRGISFTGVHGATRARATVNARAGARTLEASIALGYAGGRWRVTTLVPPDYSTVFSPPAAPVSAPPATRAAARDFAVAYADYRTGASTHPPAASVALRHQLAAHQDPLAGTPRTGAAARVLRLQLLPQGQLTAVQAVLRTGTRRLSFEFILQSTAGRWQASSFPVSAG